MADANVVLAWTEQDALNLTEDEQTRRDGAKLATRSKWPALGANSDAIWGLCQGSGKTPYQISVDTSDLAYRCSCPSKKFPCKHTMALLLLYAKERQHFDQSAAPGWVTDWLESHRKRAGKEQTPPQEVTPSEAKTDDPPAESKAQAKRAQARANRVEEGLMELRLWLSDLVRHGFTNPQVKSYGYWDRMAAALVDAQAGSIARRLRQIASIPMQGRPDWAARLLDEVSRIYLLADSYQRLDSLPPDLQEDIRAAIGWAYKRDELLSRPSRRDKWRVLGQVIEEDEQLRSRRVWLMGERSGQAALILDFAHRHASFDEQYMNGQVYDAALVYYPSAFPQRALFKQIYAITAPAPRANVHGYANFTEMLGNYAAAIGSNPWLERIPFVLHNARIVLAEQNWWLFDAESRRVPVRLAGRGETHLWDLLAQTGGHPSTLCGEWDGYEVNLLGIVAE